MLWTALSFVLFKIKDLTYDLSICNNEKEEYKQKIISLEKDLLNEKEIAFYKDCPVLRLELDTLKSEVLSDKNKMITFFWNKVYNQCKDSEDYWCREVFNLYYKQSE